jgi:hypothetical protein
MRYLFLVFAILLSSTVSIAGSLKPSQNLDIITGFAMSDTLSTDSLNVVIKEMRADFQRDNLKALAVAGAEGVACIVVGFGIMTMAFNASLNSGLSIVIPLVIGAIVAGILISAQLIGTLAKNKKAYRSKLLELSTNSL